MISVWTKNKFCIDISERNDIVKVLIRLTEVELTTGSMRMTEADRLGILLDARKVVFFRADYEGGTSYDAQRTMERF